MRRELTRGLLVVCLLALAMPALPAAGAPVRDTAVVGLAQEPDQLGLFTIMAVASVIHNTLWGYVAPFTDKWVRVPIMVEKLPTIKDGDWVLLPDKKMKVTWKLKRGFTWHDGRPVTALDYRFTYGLERNPRTPRVSRFIVNKVDNILVPNPNDPYTMVVQWNELWPFANSSPFGDQIIYPRHILERDYLRDPGTLDRHAYWRAPVATGPYRFVEWVPGSHITVEAYSKWPLGVPKVRRIVFRFILDATVLTANQISGDVHATEINNFGCLQMEQIERRNPQVQAHYREALTWERIDFNLDDPWLKDKRVRQAIAYALNRPALADIACSGGRQPVAHTWLAPGHPASNPNVKKYPFDVARARALLTEAGFTLGPDGVLRDRAGKRFEVTIMTTAGNTVREQIEQVIKDQLKAVGIDLRIDNRPASVFLGPVISRRQYPFLAMYGSLFTPESVPFDRFHSTQIPTEANAWQGNNRVGWRNAENDKIWEQLISELDEKKRIALFHKQQEIFAEELPSLPLYFRLSLTTNMKALRNIRPTGLGTYYIPWNSWEWAWAEQ
ncbi:MAG TPA: peptide ABC transporter substrate-binding protein [bacterium]|nr:peptide ABC transporter substrate-binding protein [bacterium]